MSDGTDGTGSLEYRSQARHLVENFDPWLNFCKLISLAMQIELQVRQFQEDIEKRISLVMMRENWKLFGDMRRLNVAVISYLEKKTEVRMIDSSIERQPH